MNFDNLKGFLEVIKTSNVSRAALRLHCAQPTLTQQIQRLEKEVGGKLLKFNGRIVQLTEVGATFRPYAESLLALRSEALQAIRTVTKNPRGVLLMGANDATCNYILPEALVAFRRLYPLMGVSVYRNFSYKILEKVRAGNLDIGIVSLPLIEKGLEVFRIFHEELKVLMPPDHPLARNTELTAEEVADYPLVLPKAGKTRRRIESILRPHRKRLEVSMELASVEIIKKFVSAGIGISLLPQAFAQAEMAAGTLKLVPLHGVKLYRELALIYRRKSELTFPARAFVNIVRKEWAVTPQHSVARGKEVCAQV